MAVATGARTALTLASLAALAAAGCSGGAAARGGQARGSGASCAAVLRFRHETYLGTTIRSRPPRHRLGVVPRSRLQDIGIAVEPACVDTNHREPQDTPVPVPVAQIEGVSPTIAIAALPRGNVYVAQGARIPSKLQEARWLRWASG